MASGKKLTQEEFITRAKEIHKDKYDYSKVVYKNIHTKVCIICKEHGEFWQEPNSHILKKNGCPICGISLNKKRERITSEIFFERMKNIYNDSIDFSHSEFKGRKENISAKCNACGNVLTKKAYNFLAGVGCPYCNGGVSKTFEQLLDKCNEIHNHKYDYSKVKYVNIHEPVEIVCPVHGSFWQSIHHHTIDKNECPECANIKRSQSKMNEWDDILERIKKVQGEQFDYSKAKYIGYNKDIEIICPIHGSFFQSPSNHTKGQGCPKCMRRLGEEAVIRFFEDKNIKYNYQQKYEDLRSGKGKNDYYSYDFFLPNKNLLIEIQGDGHRIPCFGSTDEEKEINYKKQLKHDEIKRKYCKEKNIDLLEINYYNSNVKNLLKDLEDLYKKGVFCESIEA